MGCTEFPGIAEEVLQTVFLFAQSALLLQFSHLVVELIDDDQTLREVVLTGRLAKR